MGADFDIVAVSWPGQQAEVAEVLPGWWIFEVRELEREQILQVITEVGFVGPQGLQTHLLNQSMARAGLAVTFAYGCVCGHVSDVTTGDALLADIVGWFTNSIGAESRHVLGVLALAGGSGATMQQGGRILGLNASRVSDLVRGLASGGMVDEASANRTGDAAMRAT